MSNRDFCRKAEQNAIACLKTYFTEGNMEKVLGYFSRDCSSWIGWGANELYLNYSDVFNTFIRRTGDIYPHVMQNIKSAVLFDGGDVCNVLVTCTLSPAPQTGTYFKEKGRFTFTFRSENGEPKIVQLHSSAPWRNLKDGEVYPLAHSGKVFYEHEQQVNSSSLPAFAAASTPNGLKCCLVEKGFPTVYINKALYKLAGYNSMTEMLNATRGELQNMVYSADLPKLKKIMAAHCSDGPYTVNYRLLRKDGTAIWVLERGQFTPTEGDTDYFVCSIAPLIEEQSSFNYGTLVNYEDIKTAQIPMDLYFKAALDIIEQNSKEEALVKLLRLCCSMAQISGAFVKDIRQSGEYMPVVAKYFNGSDEFTKLLKCTPEDIVNRFNSHGLNQCSNTGLLPKVYKDKLDALDVKAYLSKTIAAGGRDAYVLTFVALGTPHSWTEYEKDLITQTARLAALLLNKQA